MSKPAGTAVGHYGWRLALGIVTLLGPVIFGVWLGGHYFYRSPVASFHCEPNEGFAPLKIACRDDSQYASEIVVKIEGQQNTQPAGSRFEHEFKRSSSQPYAIRLTALGKNSSNNSEEIVHILVKEPVALTSEREVTIEVPEIERLTKSCPVDRTYDDHPSLLKESTRPFSEECYADEGFRITDAHFLPTSQTRASVQSPVISKDGASVTLSFQLTAGPRVDRYRGWLRGRIEITQERAAASSVPLTKSISVFKSGTYEIGRTVAKDSVKGFALRIGDSAPIQLQVGEAYVDDEGGSVYEIVERDGQLLLEVRAIGGRSRELVASTARPEEAPLPMQPQQVATPPSAPAVRVQLNGKLEAEMTSIARDARGRALTANIRIINTGTHAVQLLLAPPRPTLAGGGDDAHLSKGPTGIASCPVMLVHRVQSCMQTAPLESFVVVDPGRSIPLTFFFGSNPASKSPELTFTSSFIYRIRSSPEQEPSLSEKQKRAQLEFMTVGFPPVRVQDGE